MKTIKLLIVSDTHGDSEALETLVQQYKNFDYLIHLGDHFWDVDKLDFPGNVCVVKGNTDLRYQADNELVLEILNRKILLTHGHQYHVKYGLNKLYYSALEKNVDIVFFGHTHMSHEEEYDGILFFNPGSLTRPRISANGSYGLVEISEKGIETKILEFV